MTRLWIAVLALGLFAVAVSPSHAGAQAPEPGSYVGRGGYYNGYRYGSNYYRPRYYGGYGRGYYGGYGLGYNMNGSGFAPGYGNNAYSAANPYGYGAYYNGYGNSGYYGQPYSTAYDPLGLGVNSIFTNVW